jgi:hypothetical protein
MVYLLLLKSFENHVIYIFKRYKGQSKEISLREQLFNGDSNNDATSRENKEEQDMIYMVPVGK